MKIIFSIILSITTILCYAQSKPGKVSGTVLDENQKAVDGATISLLRNKDAALTKVAVTAKDGRFEIERIPEGEYIVSVTGAGFKNSKTQPFVISVQSATIVLPAIQLQAAAKSLGEVTVIGKKPLIENKIDRMVVNVDAAPTNAGATAMEVLEKSPGISVDNDGNISLKGKQGVIVMMDGKPTYLSPSDLANVLKNLPASALDQIEIMTNPPAKYDASGNSGIINLKTKKSKNDGLNGSITTGETIGYYKRNNSWLTPYRHTNSINMNYRKGKINLFGNFNYNYREGKGDLHLTRKFFNQDKSLNSVSNSSTEFNFRNNNYTLKAGLDYFADKKNVFGVVVNGFGFFGHPQPIVNQVISSPDGTVEAVLNSLTSNDITFYNYSTNLNYKHTFDSTGREFSADIDYVGYAGSTKSLLLTDNYNEVGGPKISQFRLRGNIPSIINIYSVKSDYTQPLKHNMRFEAGFKLSYVKNDNKVEYLRDSSGTWVNDSRSNHFIYEENINAAYVSVNKKWKKFSAQAGLRLENTIAKGNEVTKDSSFRRDYTDIFPTAYLNYDLNKNNTFTVSYGRRIQRPNYRDLNPFVFFLDSLTFQKGNPYLLPQISDNYELRHMYKGGLTTTLNYTITRDVISQILNQITDKKVTYLTTGNVAKLQNIGLAVNVPVKPFKWWNGNVYVNVYNNKYTGTYFNSFTGINDPIDLSYTSFMINISNNFSFQKGWSAEVSGFYHGKGVDQLMIMEPMYFLTIGGQKNIMKGKGTIRMNFRDPLAWQKFSGRVKYSDIDVQIHNTFDSRSITATFTYRFGKSTVPQARRRNGSATEEESRAGQQQ